MHFFIFYGLLLINIIAFAVYGIDKLCATHRRRRVPEKMLLFLSFIGGAAGSLMAMSLFRHKTEKKHFRVLVPLFLLMQITLAGLYIYRWLIHV